MKTTGCHFPESQYGKEALKKRGIPRPRTISQNPDAGHMDWWKANAQHVTLPVLSSKDGGTHQLLSSQYWAHHPDTEGACF